MSPILVRPVREQLEHDRVIRLLQAKLKRKHDVAANVGDEQTAGLKIGPGLMFPDLVLTSLDKAHKLEGIIEVETGESVNHLEAMAQWAHFGHARAPFYLYVPAAAVDIAKRLCVENHVTVTEIWSYHSMGDQTRFTLVQRSAAPPPKAAPERVAPKPEHATVKKDEPKRPATPKKPAPKVPAKDGPVATKDGARKKAAPAKPARTVKRK